MAEKKQSSFEIGVISDTHGPIPKNAEAALKGVNAIVHAGDIVDESVLFFLKQIAPVTAVRGNMDNYLVFNGLSKTSVLDFDGTLIYILHDLSRIDLDPRAAGFSIVIHGHTHSAKILESDGVLYVNPGSATSPRRSKPSVARISISNGNINARIIEIN